MKTFDLSCGHCGGVFAGTYKQAWNNKRVGTTPYCSTICRDSAYRAKFSTPVPNRGPCRTCGKEFFSRTAKLYCSMDCYTGSAKFKEMVAGNLARIASSLEIREKISATNRRGIEKPCTECGEMFYQKRPAKGRGARRFCTTVCYRSYMAKRYDRWVANPEGMALPQCYDEFLDQEELSCVVDGCGWKGLQLTGHMNLAHGVPAQEFKRAAGFNLKTGVIARPLAELLQGRPNPTVNGNVEALQLYASSKKHIEETGVRYRSKEAAEHQKKARLLIGTGPLRKCKQCGQEFVQTTPCGRALYCTVKCRDAWYAEVAKRRVKQADA